MRILLNNGASAKSWPHELGTDLTPVEYAAKKGYDDIVALLVERGAEPLAIEDAVQLRFIEVARYGSVEDLDKLMGLGADVNGQNRDGETALLAAIEGYMGFSQTELLKVKYLLDKGADLNLNRETKGRHGSLPLHELVFASELWEKDPDHWPLVEQLFQLLLDRGAFVSGVDKDGDTPLHAAAGMNALKAAEILLKAGAKVMPRDNEGKTPLDYAQSAEMIRYPPACAGAHPGATGWQKPTAAGRAGAIPGVRAGRATRGGVPHPGRRRFLSGPSLTV